MAPTGTEGSGVTRALRRALAAVLVLGILLAGGLLILALPSSYSDFIPIFYVAVFLLFLSAGVLAWWRRPVNGMGALIVLGGFAVYGAALVNTSVVLFQVVGVMLATAILAVIVHLLHAFPSGRIRGPISRTTVIVGYVVALVLQAPLYLFGPLGDGPPLIDLPLALSVGLALQRVLGTAVMIATAVLLVSRLRRADRTHRRVLLPLFSYGVVAILLVVALPNLPAPIALPPVERVLLQLAVIGGVPIAFMVAVLYGGFARTRALEELASWIGAAPDDADALQGALARTLGDASVQLLYPTKSAARAAAADVQLVDGHGRAAASRGPGRAAVEVTRGDHVVAVITYDPRLIADESEVKRAGRIITLTVERQRLTAQLSASERALRRSRRRLVAASDNERRRIARDLHDGVQAQLVLLAVDAHQLARDTDRNELAHVGAMKLRERVDAAADDLRALVHAVMPAGLLERGLVAAIEDLVDRMPILTTSVLTEPVGDLPAAVESTAYFVVAESLANTIKYSGASSSMVTLTRGEGILRIEISDDGVGGARVRDGRGLRGMIDRVEALDGTLDLSSPPGEGTRIDVELPCES